MDRCNPSLLLAFPKRYTRFMLLGCSAFALFLFFGFKQVDSSSFGGPIVLEESLDYTYPQIDYPSTQLNPDNTEGKPPLFEAYRTYEDEVSKANLERYGKPGDRYIYFRNHAWSVGWGNVMQEMVFHTLVASGSGRGYVWDDYSWERPPKQYSDYNGKLIPSQVPLSTMIGGYLLGLPVPREGNSTSSFLPPSISRHVYEAMCPESLRITISRELVQNFIGHERDLTWSLSGQEVLDAWLSYLDQPIFQDKKCIEVQADTPQIFDIWVLNGPRVHSVVDTLLKAPVLQHWGWSQLVRNLFAKNIAHFVSAKSLLQSAGSRVSRFFSSSVGSILIDGYYVPSLILDRITRSQTSPLPLLVLHLRRGDYEGHCWHLATYRSQYIGVNMLPEFERDAFVPPEYREEGKTAPNSTEGMEWVGSPEEMKPIYDKHCFPDIAQIKVRVREVLHDYEQLLQEKQGTSGHLSWFTGRTRAEANQRVKKVYIMSNGDRQWLKDVKEALEADAARSVGASMFSKETADWEFLWSWDEISTSRDIVAGWEENRVSQILDMYVAQRAELFIGNGFSTLTSNIVMLRQKNGFDPIQTRFW